MENNENNVIKEVGKVPKNKTTDIVVRIDTFRGKKGVTIREYVSSVKYTGFTRAGVRIPPEEFQTFRDIINSIDISELEDSEEEIKEEENENEEEKSEEENEKEE